MLTTLLLLLAQSHGGAAEDPIACGPFLLQPGPRTMTIVIDDETPSPATLRYWSADQAERVVEHPEPARHHAFTLDQLEPDTEFSYQVRAGAGSSATHAFRTLPLRPERYRVLAVGDVRTHPEEWAAVSGRMFEREQGALFAIGTGDYPSDGRKYQQWVDQFFAPARDFLGRMPLWPAIGNHEATRPHDDVTQIEQSHYFSLFELPGNERWYRVDYHLITLLVVDSNSSLAPDKPQYQWLRTQLRSPRNRFTLVALHHAPHTSGPHARLLPDGTPEEWPIDEGRRFLVPLFEMYDVDIVLCGHDHLYERSEKDGVVYIVTGGGGAPLYKINSTPNPFQRAALAAHHYTTLDIDAGGIDLTAIAKSGAIIDRHRVPVGRQHLARRTQSLTAALDRSVEVGALDARTMRAPVQLANPLDHPLTVHVTSAANGHPVEPLTVKLEPGERREVPLAVQDVGGQLAAEPWRAAIILDLLLRFEGKDQALELAEERPLEATVYNPVYRTQRWSEPAAGFPSCPWSDQAAIKVDERTPVVKNPESYAGAEDLSADVRFMWSPGHLHLSVDIRDDQVLDDPATSMDENDGVRLLFDPSPGTSQGLTVFTFGASGRNDAEGESHTAIRREGGWTLEAHIPLEALGLEPDAGASSRVSCDLLLIDRDRTGDDALPSYHRLWTKSTSLSDRSTFGVLVFDE